ncbi:MAG: metallophosphoesterase family protein [Chloroflexota bacterium]
MKVAIISDIHGNAVALDAVLAEVKRDNPDKLVCLGDVAGIGPQPREVIDRLSHLDIPVVNGNVDDMLLNPPAPEEMPDDRRPVADILHWGLEQLSSADRDFMRSFQPTVEIELDSRATLLCFHGSPASNWDLILATTPDDEVERMLTPHTATVMTGGHTHVQMIRRYRNTIVVNPGSVGLPAEDSERGLMRPPWAEYGLASWEDGALSITLRRIPVDVGVILQMARDSGMPNVEWWSESWHLESQS